MPNTPPFLSTSHLRGYAYGGLGQAHLRQGILATTGSASFGVSCHTATSNATECGGECAEARVAVRTAGTGGDGGPESTKNIVRCLESWAPSVSHRSHLAPASQNHGMLKQSQRTMVALQRQSSSRRSCMRSLHTSTDGQ